MCNLKPGDKIEFWSGYNGGCWRPGIVVGWWCWNTRMNCIYVRIQTGPKVTIVRPIQKIRKV